MLTGFIQYNVSRNPDENIKIIRQALSTNRYDIAVLPELCLYGYLFANRDELAAAAEKVPGGCYYEKLLELSAEFTCTLVYGTAEFDCGSIYNTAVVVSRGKYVGKYRKRHLSDFEKRLFTCGDSIGIFEVGSIKIGVEICFDLWFPEISRELLLAGADIICVLANFGGETSRKIAQLRAVENLTPLVLCNRIGHESLPDIDADFLGKSAVFDRDGSCLAGDTTVHQSVSVELDLAAPRSNVICRDFMSEISQHYNR